MRIAIYLRLSVSDDDLAEGNESNSIENQRLIIMDYIERTPGLNESFVSEYVDDGYSGTNFERPGFKRMIEDVRNGLIDIIIVKDLSRLGRDYIETGDYLDQIFPMLGVRVIAINSGYDSDDHKGDVSGLDVALTNYLNALYSWDLSAKQKSGNIARWKSGKSMICSMPYGYMYDKENKKKWVIDEEAAGVVREVFGYAADAKNLASIVDILNERKVTPPAEHRYQNEGIRYRRTVSEKEYLWDKRMVRKILKNYAYTGATVCHTIESVPYVFNKFRKVPKDEWIVIENDHEGIVDKETFDKAQKILQTGSGISNIKPAKYSLRSRLRCSNCNLMFSYRNDGGKEFCYCAHKHNAGKYSKCNGRQHSYDLIEKRVHQLLKKYICDMRIIDNILDSVIPKITPEYKESLEETDQRVAFLKNERIELYSLYSEGSITIEQYKLKKSLMNEEIEKLEKKATDIRNSLDSDRRMVKSIESIENEAEVNGLDTVLNARMVNLLVKQVYVDEND
ncbi:MAG: recombinase family protein, partial [Lachnospiraceae bacterium]|nr:recombinase family protein [Lachnospiraceae bacterium]